MWVEQAILSPTDSLHPPYPVKQRLPLSTDAPTQQAAPPRSPRARPRWVFLTWSGAVFVLLAAVRLPYLPRLGNGYDLEAYRSWAAAIQDHGLANVFATTDTDYVGFHYLLWAIGKADGRPLHTLTLRDKQLRLWLKSPGIVGDVLSTALVAAIVLDLSRSAPVRPRSRLCTLARRAGLSDAQATSLGAMVLWGMNPALIYASSYWGQNDSLIIAFALAAVWLAVRRRPAWAAVALGIGALIKPGPLVVGPVLAWVVYSRSGWRGFARAAGAGALTLLLGHAYFLAQGDGAHLLRIYRNAAVTVQHMSFNAYNVWWPATVSSDPAPADRVFGLGPFAVSWGFLAAALTLAVVGATLRHLLRRPDGPGAFLAAAYLVFGYFFVGSGQHERYALPTLALIIVALPWARRWAWPLLVLTATVTVNAAMGIPLDRLYREGEPAWLTLTVCAVNLILFAWMTWQMLHAQSDQKDVDRSLTPTLDRGSR